MRHFFKFTRPNDTPRLNRRESSDSVEEFKRMIKEWNNRFAYCDYHYEYVPLSCVRKLFPDVDWDKVQQMDWPR